MPPRGGSPASSRARALRRIAQLRWRMTRRAAARLGSTRGSPATLRYALTPDGRVAFGPDDHVAPGRMAALRAWKALLFATRGVWGFDVVAR